MPVHRTYTVSLYILTFLVILFLAANLTSQIFLRGETVAVPSLTGLEPSQAREVLSKNKIVLSVKGWRFSGQQEKGKILEQDPSAGSRIAVYRAVQVVLSKGSEQVVVPSIVGKTLEVVNEILVRAGLHRGFVSFIHTPRYPAGRIIGQFPQAESRAFRDTGVNLLVSQGEREDKFLMPDLIERRAELVRAYLTAQGFRFSVSGASYYPGLESGVVIRQYPPHGFPVQKTTLITVEVSK